VAAKAPHRVFLDTSVWVAGIASERGAAREILRLAEAGLLRVVVTERVLIELDRVLAAKLPAFVEEVRGYLLKLRPEVVEEPGKSELKPYEGLIEAGDVAILAAADLARVDYLVSWDKRDFLKASVRAGVSCDVVDPGTYLRAYRDGIGREASMEDPPSHSGIQEMTKVYRVPKTRKKATKPKKPRRKV
jgi:predicted nucleic acid-binding protein